MFAASKSGKATAVVPVVPDTYFPYVSFLSGTTGTNGQTNNTFLDASSNAFSITRNGSATQSSITPYLPNGYWSNYFNNNYLSVANNAGFDFGANNFTIEAWVFFNNFSSANGNVVVSKGAVSSVGADFYSLQATSSGVISFFFGSGSTLLSGSTLVASRWYQLAVTRSGTNFTLWVDGVSSATATSSATLSAGGPLIVASQSFSPGAADRSLYGYISNLSILNGTAKSSFTLTSPLSTSTTNQTFLTCYSNRFIDANTATTAKTITVVGPPRVQAFQPFSPTASYTTALYGGSGYFDGSSYLNTTAAIVISGQFSVECWFYRTATAAALQTLFSFNSLATSYGSVRIDTDAGNVDQNITLLTSTTGTAWTSTSSVNTAYIKNAWNQVVATRDSSNVVRLFLNGVLINTPPTVSGALYSVSTTNAIACNTLPGTATNIFNGYISDLRLVNGSIPAVYQTSSTTPGATIFSPPTAPISAVTNTNLLLSFTNAGVYDSAVQTPLITSGAAQSNTSIYKWSPSSMKFDGTSNTCVTFADLVNGPTDLNTATSTNAWTIECWLYYTSGGKIVSKGGNPGVTSPSYDFSVSSGTGTFTLASSAGTIGSPGYTITYPASSIPTSTWVYWAATRTTAGIISTYINGVWQGSSGASVTVYNINNLQFALGATATTYGIGTLLTGYIQDFRITKGIARYSGSGSFTPPSAAFATK